MRFKYLFIMLLATITFRSFSQINIFSPYTRYGIGKPVFGGNGQNIALGNTSIGCRTKNTINSVNPASYTSQDSMSFVFNISLTNNLTQFNTTDLSENKYKFYFNDISIGFPITKWLKSSIGLKPYSSVGYSTKFELENENFGNFYYGLNGSGGFNKFYIGNSIEIAKRISVGFNFSYLFGSITHKIIIENSDYHIFDVRNSANYNAKGLQLNLGIQYYQKLLNNFRLTVGLIYDLNTNMNAYKDITYYNQTSYIYNNSEKVVTDTIMYVYNEKIDITIPQKIGAGFTLEYKEKISLYFDYSQQDWTNTPFQNINNSLSNSTSYNIGIEFVPNKYSFKRYSDHIRYRIGAFYSDSYLMVQDENLIDKGITAGLGLPLDNGKTMFNIAYEFGIFGTTNNNLVQENYNRFTFNLIIYDFWFFKRKFD